MLHRKTSMLHRKQSKPPQRTSMPQRTVTINVPQGVGDIFWCYQKLSPYFDVININILIVSVDKVQIRAKAWLSLLPKVGRVVAKQIRSEEYDRIISSAHPIKNLFRSRRSVDYSCNRPLENGVRLENIDPDSLVEWSVPLKMQEFPLDHKDFISLYVSGTTKNPSLIRDKVIWTEDEWVRFIRLLYDKHKLNLPICMVGASYDKEVTEGIQNKLNAIGINTTVYIDLHPANVMYLMKQSKLFIGYQSGLNILADNVDIPQLMFYFPYLEKMQYTWCKKENIGKKFQATLFSKSPEEIVDQFKLTL